MKMKKLAIWLILPVAALGRLVAAGNPGPDLNLVITANDLMKFSVTRIEAHPGQIVHLTFRNEGTMPKTAMGHNWILLKLGRDPAAYAAAASSAAEEGYQPKSRSDDVLASTPLLGPKQSAEITFTIPAVPGHYPYLCSFPAHFLVGMKGELVVK
ncbi:MAG: azurin [Verrucomicrobia bacterium]|nr:azurin [Verrucomicrobiota bacterium]